MFYNIKKGLDIPIKGQPDERIDVASPAKQVAILGSDYVGLKPTMLVKQGDPVKVGTPLFEDKKNPGVIITSPAAGVVSGINRGAQRALVSVVVDVDGDASETFATSDLAAITQEQVRDLLIKSGSWSAFRSRPYGKIPAIDSAPNSIFVNAMDTNPLAVEPTIIIAERAADFATGVSLLAKFGVPVYVCQAEGVSLPDLNDNGVQIAKFAGKHPAGLTSTHVHSIDPVDGSKTVWAIGYQDTIALGALVKSGKVDVARYVAVGGPLVNSPRVLASRLGANISELVDGRTAEGKKRVVSGSVLNGHEAKNDTDFLGRYDNQISILEENDDREFMGWAMPGISKFSALNVFISSLFKPKAFDITTSQNGSPRAIVPVGVFEKVMPLDILPTPLLKSLLVKDTDAAQQLGCLELVEEDLALCSFVDPGKHDFGPVLRSTLTQIEREG